MSRYRIPYLKMIQRRCRFCFMEYNGARICLEGRSQTGHVSSASNLEYEEWHLHNTNIRKQAQRSIGQWLIHTHSWITYWSHGGGPYMERTAESTTWKARRGPIRSRSSIGRAQQSWQQILGRVATWHAIPTHGHTTCQSTRRDWSRHAWTHVKGPLKWGSYTKLVEWLWLRWVPAQHATHPIVQWTTAQHVKCYRSCYRLSGLTKNSKNATIPNIDRMCATVAMTDPNLVQHESSIGPMNRESMKRVSSTVAFHTTGPNAMTAIRTSALGGWVPSGLGNDLTNV